MHLVLQVEMKLYISCYYTDKATQCGAVVRVESQGSDDSCVPGSNHTVGRVCRSFG
jgi:hypothetical protein